MSCAGSGPGRAHTPARVGAVLVAWSGPHPRPCAELAQFEVCLAVGTEPVPLARGLAASHATFSFCFAAEPSQAASDSWEKAAQAVWVLHEETFAGVR
jgi:hypothetical protein